MDIKMNEQYFVASECDEPCKIFFTPDDAFESQYSYIDSFDKNGDKVQSYKWVDDKYTTEF